MSIPDPTIDPVTGLPLLNPSDVVQQIPLGVQAFPWQDMGATALPTRGPLYGDDILPVSAFVAGQHPSTGSAQTVETDGAHALLVKDVGGASSGPGKASLHHQVVWNNQGIAPSATANLGGYGVVTSLWGFSFSMVSVSGATGNVWFRNSVSHSVLWSLSIGCGPNGQFFYTQMFPYGILPSADMGPDELIDQLFAAVNGADATVNASFWWQ